MQLQSEILRFRMFAGVLVFSCQAASAWAQGPAPASVVNPASNIPGGLPNSGPAQASIFVVYGAGMGPAALALAGSLPLPTTAGLAGDECSYQVSVATGWQRPGWGAT